MRFAPYIAAFAARFQLVLQYRAAALAGFVTQLWWGGIRVMVFAAFYASAPAAAAAAPISLSQAITYTWLGQALLALQPWTTDPEVAQSVRTGAVGYDRLRPVDVYAYWFARAAGWMLARALPRAVLMFLAAAVVLPLLGFEEWSWRAPSDAAAALTFLASLVLMVLLSSALTVLANAVVVVTLNERGINAVLVSVVLVFSGMIMPLALFPDGWRDLLLLQPFAGLGEIPFRIYLGSLAGADAAAGLALQAFWTLVLVVAGRRALEAAFARLQVQGG